MSQRREPKRPSERSVVPQADRGAAGGLTYKLRPRAKALAVVLLAALVSLALVSTLLKVLGPGEQSELLTAAIVDQLSLTQPNPDFAQTASDLLQQAGFTVDYYPGEEVTVDFYRNLPARDYDLIVLRVHSGISGTTGSIGLFTSEPYDTTKYVAEQRAVRLGQAHYYDGGEVYFGIYPEFLASDARGTFDKALIVMMGCFGLKRTDLAKAFVQRGAAAVVSWDGLVSAPHTDAATENLLQHLLVDRLTVGQAVAKTMAEVGPDPANGSSLLFYPPEGAAGGPGEAYSAR